MLLLALLVASPLVLTALAVGLVVAVLQAVTQVQDVALSTVPKILAVMAALLLSGPWMMQRLVEFAQRAMGLAQ